MSSTGASAAHADVRSALGLVAGHGGLGSVFLVSTLVVLGGAAVAMRLLRAPAGASLTQGVGS